jgi:hypothetical protein
MKTSPVIMPDIFERNTSNRSFILEKLTSQEESSDEEKDGTIKLSRLSSKISKETSSKDPSNPHRIIISSMIRTYILTDILNKVIAESENGINKQVDKKLRKIENSDEDDSEDEYFKMIERRNQQLNNPQGHTKNGTTTESVVNNQRIASIVNNTISSHSRFANKLTEQFKVRIYLLNTQIFIDFGLSSNETVKDLKRKVLTYLESGEAHQRGIPKIKYHILEAYDIRMVDDDDDEIVPNMEFPPFEDRNLFLKAKTDTVAFVEKLNYNPDSIQSVAQSILGIQTKDNETKITVKVYLKSNGGNYATIQLNHEKTLRNILEKLSSQNKISHKNFDLYYFLEHVENSKEEIDDIDNAINMDTPLKFLNNFELDLFFKKFPDAPESVSYSQFSQRLVNYNEFNNTYQGPQVQGRKTEVEEIGREYIFNDISAGVYQEFDVIKINKYKSKQERILGIDLYNLYNDLPKKTQSNLLNIFSNGTKKPLRKIKDILSCGYLSNKVFFIEIKMEGKSKQIIYEVKNVNVRNEIVAKIKYLIVK